MDSGFFSHVVLWVIGGIAAFGLIGTVGALFTMGRNANYKKPLSMMILRVGCGRSILPSLGARSRRRPRSGRGSPSRAGRLPGNFGEGCRFACRTVRRRP